MAITEETFSVSASSLFETLTDPYTYPHWLVGTRNIRAVSEDWPDPTSYFKHTVGFGPIAIRDRTVVRRVERPRMLEMYVRARPIMEAVVRFDVEPARSGCLLRLEETPVGIYKLMSVIAQPLITARNARSMKRLKAYVEGEVGATPMADSPIVHDPRLSDGRSRTAAPAVAGGRSRARNTSTDK